MSRKIVCLLLVSFVALAAVNFAAAEEKKADAAAAVPCSCAGPVVCAPAPVVYAPSPFWRPFLYHRYCTPVCAPVCEPCCPAPVVYRRGLLGYYRPLYAW